MLPRMCCIKFLCGKHNTLQCGKIALFISFYKRAPGSDYSANFTLFGANKCYLCLINIDEHFASSETKNSYNFASNVFVFLIFSIVALHSPGNGIHRETIFSLQRSWFDWTNFVRTFFLTYLSLSLSLS